MKKEKAVRDFFNNNPDFLNTLREGQFGCADRWIGEESIPSGANDLKPKLDSIEKNIEKKISRRKTSRRRFVAIAVPITLALVFFFAITNPGQALAETMFRTVGQLFNGSLVIQHDDSGQQIVQEESASMDSGNFTSIEQAAAYANNPLVYIRNEKVKIDQIIVQDLEGICVILTYYNFDDQYSFILQQQVFKDRTANTASTPVESNFTEYIILNNNKLYFSNTLEGNLIAIGEWDNTQIQISSDDMSVDDFIGLFQNLITT